MLDGLHDSSIETVVTRHEGGAGFMALAEGRLTELPGVAMVTRGPGAANAFIAIHTAHQDATPMILFVGLIPVVDRGRESFQEFDINAWFGSTAKKVVTLDDAASAAARSPRRRDVRGKEGVPVVHAAVPVGVVERQAPVRRVLHERQTHVHARPARRPVGIELLEALSALVPDAARDAGRRAGAVGGRALGRGRLEPREAPLHPEPSARPARAGGVLETRDVSPEESADDSVPG